MQPLAVQNWGGYWGKSTLHVHLQHPPGAQTPYQHRRRLHPVQLSPRQRQHTHTCGCDMSESSDTLQCRVPGSPKHTAPSRAPAHTPAKLFKHTRLFFPCKFQGKKKYILQLLLYLSTWLLAKRGRARQIAAGNPSLVANTFEWESLNSRN